MSEDSIAKEIPVDKKETPVIKEAVDLKARIGKYFFAVMFIAFGIDHFIYVKFVSGLVPKWIPFPIFWTYFTGIALLGAGVSVLLNFKIKIVFQLAAVMLFIWLITIHIPLAIKYPEWNDRENVIACFQCLAFTGIALLIATTSDKTVTEPRASRGGR